MAQTPEEFLESLGPEEDLHSDLVPYLFDLSWSGLPALKHPLVFAVPYIARENHRLNQQYEYKVRSIREAVVAKDWGQVIWLHERPHRLDAFLQIAEHLDEETYWSLAADIWVDSENIWQNREEWEEVLSGRPDPRLFMGSEEMEAFDKLPDPLIVYRGATLGVNDDGLSWTLDYDRALWFAKRLRRPGEQRGVVTGRVTKADVVGLLNDRGEDEVVVPSVDVVEILGHEEVAEDG